MRFAWPYLLLLLLVPLALLLRNLFQRSRAQASNAKTRILAAETDGTALHLANTRETHSRTGRLRLWTLLASIFAIIALARPQWGLIEEPVFEQSREILIGLDLSRSMQADDVKPSRLARGKLLIQSLLDHLKGERIGLVVFSGTAFLQSPLSTDYEILRDLLPDLGPDFLPEGGTAYQALLRCSIDAFSTASNADRFLIILSDGEALDDNWKTLVPNLTSKNIRVIGLGVGTVQGAMVPDGTGGLVKDERGAAVLSRLEPDTLGELAKSTQGVYRDASTWVDLNTLIQTTVEQGKQGGFVEKRAARHEERYQWPLALALVFALAGLVFEFPARIRPRRIGPATKTAAALVLLAALLGAPPRLFAEETTEAPLISTVRTLSAKETLSSTDYAQIANDTLAWGKTLKESGQPIPPGAVHDGLDAVNKGAALAPKAADWPTLKKNMETLLSQKDKPKQKPEDKQHQQQDQNQDQKQQPKNEQPQEKNQPQEQQKQQEQSQEQKNQQQQQEQQKAFGDMQQQPQNQQPPEEMQTVGSKDQPPPSDKENPAMVLPLEKLEKVKELDSPGRLFQMMEQDDKAPKKGASGRPKKNW